MVKSIPSQILRMKHFWALVLVPVLITFIALSITGELLTSLFICLSLFIYGLISWFIFYGVVCLIIRDFKK